MLMLGCKGLKTSCNEFPVCRVKKIVNNSLLTLLAVKNCQKR